MIRRLLTAALPIASLLIGACGSSFAGERPNILFLLSDDQRADTIQALGNSRIRTPNLDRLVESGLTFTRAYCMGSNQQAVCVPSRAMLLSGKSLFRIPERLETVTTWPKAFAESGYETFGTGKWHNGAAAYVATFESGKAAFFGGMQDPNAISVRDLGLDAALGDERIGERHATELFAEAAIEFLSRRSTERPFCLYAAFTVPHDPRISPPPYDGLYTDAPPPTPANYRPLHPFNNGEMTVRDERLAPWPRTADVIRRQLADYYAAITHMDAQIGRILDTLVETGEYNNTIIVFTSDHGLAMGSHGLLGKQNLYEHSMRVPLVACGPGIPRDKRSDAMCYLFDLYPTLCELADVVIPRSVEGRSLAPVIRGERDEHRDVIFTAYRDFQRAIRTDCWKLIRYPQVNKSQLFDLHADPDEIHDLSDKAEHRDRVMELTSLLERAQREYEDECPLTVESPLPLEFDFGAISSPGV